MTHTKGPWSLVVNDDPRGQPSPFYRGIIALVEKGDRHLTVVSDGREVPLEEWEPNGRLIAASPYMLAALEGIVALLDDGDTSAQDAPTAIAKCKMAIAEARGK